MQELLLKSEETIQENVTERWKSDMSSDSWLSKNVRPLVLIFLVLCTMLLVFIDAGILEFKVEDKWISLLEITLLTVIGAYFGGRSIEKVKNTNFNQNMTMGRPYIAGFGRAWRRSIALNLSIRSALSSSI